MTDNVERRKLRNRESAKRCRFLKGGLYSKIEKIQQMGSLLDPAELGVTVSLLKALVVVLEGELERKVTE